LYQNSIAQQPRRRDCHCHGEIRSLYRSDLQQNEQRVRRGKQELRVSSVIWVVAKMPFFATRLAFLAHRSRTRNLHSSNSSLMEDFSGSPHCTKFYFLLFYFDGPFGKSVTTELLSNAIYNGVAPLRVKVLFLSAFLF